MYCCCTILFGLSLSLITSCSEIILGDDVTNLPLKENLNKNAFDRLKVNINIPSIGKLYCTWDKYKAIKKRYKNIIELYHDTNNKED